MIAGCSGGSSSTSSAQPASNGPTATVSLSASATAIDAGESVTLSWSSNNATGCTASGGWSGSRSTSGSESVGPLNQTTSFTLSCAGSGGGGLAEVTVQVNTGNGVSITLSANPSNVVQGGTTTLQWTSQNANTCTATLGWSGSQPLSGSFVAGPLNQTTSFELSCDGPTGTGIALTTVQVLDKTLRWQAPTQNVDGSPLLDLAGYRIYWGLGSRSYTDSHTINDSAITEWDVTAPPNTYYFALTAFDADGNESGYSNEVQKIIP